MVDKASGGRTVEKTHHAMAPQSSLLTRPLASGSLRVHEKVGDQENKLCTRLERVPLLPGIGGKKYV